ncbi:MAG: MarR family transcriptional regulator, partial [Oscillospiraceae bacterium]|nr:MarR family transcriptional regulator [Oscillospiraceae bacterium]
MKKKLLAFTLALILCVSLLAACNTTDAETTPTPDGTADITPEATPDTLPPFITFEDSAGRTVELPTNITKVSPSGALAQMYILAIAPELLGTISSEYSAAVEKYIPDYVLSLPVVGQFYGSEDLNFESIAALGPEIVIDVGEPKATIVEDMDSITANLAIPAVHITATLDSTPAAFRTLGKILGREEKGEEGGAWLSQMRDYLCVSKAAVSQMLSALEGKGFITREADPENRRTIIVKLTDRGREMIDKIEFEFDKNVGVLIDRFGEDDTREIIRLIYKFAGIIDEF